MKFRIKILDWSAGIPVALLSRKNASILGLSEKDRILIKTDHTEFSAILDIGSLAGEHLGVSTELANKLSLKSNQQVDVSLIPHSKSFLFIKKKLNKKVLSESEILAIIKDIVNNSLSEAEIAMFVSGVYKNGMNMRETISLTKAILSTGNKLNLKNKLIVDKHCIGGIPGNRTTPIVVSICAAAGLIFPKTSSRAITSAAGTADVIETIAKVDFSLKELREIIGKTNGCLAWGGALGLAPADDKLIQVEKILGVDPEAQLLASIFSKKLSVGSTHILIDIPYGKGAKVTHLEAEKLKEKFEILGREFHKKVVCVLTDGSEPIGNGVGPALELKDIIAILSPDQKGPRDLEDKSLFLAGKIFEMTGKAEKGKGPALAMQYLDSGIALEKFKEIIRAQKGDISKIPSAKYSKKIYLKKAGKIVEIKNSPINTLARILGCPNDKASGVYLHHHCGEFLRKDEPILTLYSNSFFKIRDALKFLKEEKPIVLEHK